MSARPCQVPGQECTGRSRATTCQSELPRRSCEGTTTSCPFPARSTKVKATTTGSLIPAISIVKERVALSTGASPGIGTRGSGNHDNHLHFDPIKSEYRFETQAAQEKLTECRERSSAPTPPTTSSNPPTLPSRWRVLRQLPPWQ